MDKEKLTRIIYKLDENILLSYSKIGVLVLMEVLGWLTALMLIILSAYIIVKTPSVTFESNDLHYVLQNKELNQLFKMVSIVCIVCALPVVLITLFIRRFRRKKFQIAALIRELKAAIGNIN